MVARGRVRRMAAIAALGALVLANLAVVPARALAFTYIVDTKGDGVDDDLANPSCHTSEDTCSLRAAIMQANVLDPGSGHHTIRLNAGGVVFMSIENTGGEEDDAEEGDYDIWRDVHIVGGNMNTTQIIAGGELNSGIDRIFDLRGNNVHVEISNMTLFAGDAGSRTGGTILADDAGQSIVLDHVVIEQSYALNAGTAIYSAADLTIRDSIIRDGFGRNSTIEMQGGDLILRRSTIRDNHTQLNASAFRLGFESQATVERTTISGNTSGTGGPILVGRNDFDDSSLTLRNSTMSGNSGSGAMISSFAEGVVTVQSSTIAGNTGWGIDLDGPSHFKNTILASNSLGNCRSHPGSDGYNLDTHDTCGFDSTGDIHDGKSKLASLANYGGPTRTRALNLGSDAIDAGSGCPDQDQRGVARPKDGDGDGNARCDIGAYEYPNVAPVATPTPEVTPSPTPEVTPEVTVAPATDAPVTDAPATEVPSLEPGASPAASEAPAATSVGGATAAPAPTAQPEPTGGGDSGNLLLPIVLAAGLLGLLLGLYFASRRRRSPPASG